MKWLIVWGIRLYWRFAPRSLRDRCLFKESCSHHVMSATVRSGALAGLKALSTRFHECRPGSSVIGPFEDNDGAEVLALRLSNGTIVPWDDVSERVARMRPNLASLSEQYPQGTEIRRGACHG